MKLIRYLQQSLKATNADDVVGVELIAIDPHTQEPYHIRERIRYHGPTIKIWFTGTFIIFRRMLSHVPI